MFVVADTSPLNYLILIEQTAVLPALYARVLLPPAVVTELRDPEAPETARAWVDALPSWCETRRPTALAPGMGLEALGAGEREAIMLAQEARADALLIDEDGRRAARACALIVTGTLGVLERAAARELLDLPDVIARLRATSFRVRESLLLDLLARDAARKRLM
jgi:predicted nucleic acid-binding protein